MFKKVFMVGSNIALLLLLLAGTVVYAQNAGQKTVVILVVDDFTTNTVADINNSLEGKEFSDLTLCYFNPVGLIEGQAMADGMGGAVVDANGQPISHGDLVLSQTLEMIENLSTNQPFGNITITAVPVAVKSYVIADIATAIDTTTHQLETTLGTDPDQVYFVINMSFALVPCNVYSTLVGLIKAYTDAEEKTAGIPASDIAEWNALQSTLAAVENNVFQESMDAIKVSGGHCAGEETTASAQADQKVEPTSDALPPPEVCKLRQILFKNNVIPVASSGNFGFDFPTLPAAWEGVISVSAGPECAGFNSVGGSPNRLISQRLTFLPQMLEPVNPIPCPSIADIEMIISNNGLAKVYSSSKGEIMMPGIWDYGTGLTTVQALENSGTNQTIINSRTNTLTNDFMEYELRMQANTFNSVGVVPGTSFAAPRMSFAMAVYLAALIDNGGSICLTNGLIGLAYADPASVPNWNGMDYNLGDRSNIAPLCPNLYMPDVIARLGI